MTQTSISETVRRDADLLARVLDGLAAVADGITPERLRDPTPCAGYDVATLRRHVLGWLETFADGYADPDGQAPRSSLDDYDLPDDADCGARFRAAAAKLGDAIAAGAAGRPLRLGEYPMPGDTALSMILWDSTVHGWDLARATGQPWTPPEAAATESLAFAPGMLTDDYQGEGKPFAPRIAVPDSAPALDRLLGLCGRDPAWKP